MLGRFGISPRLQRISLSLIALFLAIVIAFLQGEPEVDAAHPVAPPSAAAPAGVETARATTREQAIAQAIRWLKAQEGGKHRGHTIERHVGKSDRALRDRLRREGKSVVSGFFDLETAAVAVVRTIRHKSNHERVKRWLDDDDSKRRLALRRSFKKAIGRIVYRDGNARDGKTAVAVLTKWRERGRTSYRLLTAYVER